MSSKSHKIAKAEEDLPSKSPIQGNHPSEDAPPAEPQPDIGDHLLYDHEDMRVAYKRSSDETREVLRDVQILGPSRMLQRVPDDYAERCEALRADFPNFGHYIDDFLLPEFALNRAADGILKISPSVLLGPPGVGKTLFVESFC